MGYYVHHVPGRVRVKIPTIKNRPLKAKQVRQVLECQGGLDQIDINLATGSVVVHYDSDITSADQVLSLLEYHDFFDKSMTYGIHEEIERVSSRAGQAIGKAAFGWTLNRVLDANGLSFIAALI